MEPSQSRPQAAQPSINGGSGPVGAAFRKSLTCLHIAGSCLILVMMLVIVFDVLGRAFFNHPLTGAPELVRVCVVGVLFLGLPETFRAGKQIRATLLLNKVSGRVLPALDLLAHLGGVLLFVLLVYSSWDLLVQAWEVGEFEGAGALRVPTYPIRALIVVSAALALIQLAISAWHSANKFIGKD